MTSENGVEQQQVYINLAVLYATLIIILGTVVTEWPPRRLDALFWTSSLITGVITLRILSLIYHIEREDGFLQGRSFL